MASPFHHHSQGAWLYFFDRLSLGGGTPSKLGINVLSRYESILMWI
jgi:hypothetical protein